METVHRGDRKQMKNNSVACATLENRDKVGTAILGSSSVHLQWMDLTVVELLHWSLGMRDWSSSNRGEHGSYLQCVGPLTKMATKEPCWIPGGWQTDGMLQDLKDTKQPPSFILLNLPGWLFQKKKSDSVLEANKPKQTVIPLAFVAVAVTP